MPKPITDYKITDHGVEHSQYFQGAGTAFSKWEDCFTGIGNSPGEALENALEDLAGFGEYDHASLPDGWDEGVLKLTDDRVTPIIEDWCSCESCKRDEDTGKSNCTHECKCFENSELHYFVTLYVK